MAIDWNKNYTPKNSKIYWQFSDNLLKELLRRLPDFKTVLDIGAGRGELAKQLFDRGYAVKGIDISKEAIKIAKQNYPSISLEEKNIEKGKIDKYDVIFLKLVLAFLKNKEEVLNKLKASSKFLILVTPVVLSGFKDISGGIAIEEKELDVLLDNCFSNKKVFFKEKKEKGLELRVYILS